MMFVSDKSVLVGRVNVHPTERGFQFILSNYIITLEVVTISLDNMKGDKR